MDKKQRQVKTDPELLRQLEQAAPKGETVQAVFTLALPKKQLLDPLQVEQVTKELVERVTRSVGTGVSDLNIFRNLGAFVICAESPFIRELLNEPEIASATANKQPENSLTLTSK